MLRGLGLSLDARDVGQGWSAVRGSSSGRRGDHLAVPDRGAWRDLPVEFGPWQTIWKRHARFSKDGTWDKILAALLAQADARG